MTLFNSTNVLQLFCPGRDSRFVVVTNKPNQTPIVPEGTVYFRGILKNIADYRFQILKMVLLISGFVFMFSPSASAQTFSETIKETVRFQDINSSENELYIHNINGNVTVEGYNGNEIQITYHKKIDADTQRDLDRAIEEVEFIIEEESNRILIYLDAPFICVKKRDGKISYNINDWDDDYDFMFDISIRVPQNTNLDVSTINNGRVLVENIHSKWLDVSNINGSVELGNVAGITDAKTINGDITASYRENPSGDSSFETINGTIEVMFPENLSADITFKSMHGDLYTDFKNVQRLQARVESSEERGHGKTTYRIDKFAPLRIGNGGPTFKFEVLNGDVYVKRNRAT